MAPLSIGLDYFNIEVNDVISAPSTQEIVSQNALGNPAYAGLVIRDPVTNQIVSTKTLLANTGTMSVNGMDLDVRYREKLGAGRAVVDLQGTYYFTFDQTSPAVSVLAEGRHHGRQPGQPGHRLDQRPGWLWRDLRYKQYLSATWQQGDWATTLGNSYATGYHAGWDLNGNPTRMPTMTLWDLQVAYTGFKNAVLTLGGRNIFDKQPATFVSVSNAFQSGYDSSQYDPRGRCHLSDRHLQVLIDRPLDGGYAGTVLHPPAGDKPAGVFLALARPKTPGPIAADSQARQLDTGTSRAAGDARLALASASSTANWSRALCACPGAPIGDGQVDGAPPRSRC